MFGKLTMSILYSLAVKVGSDARSDVRSAGDGPTAGMFSRGLLSLYRLGSPPLCFFAAGSAPGSAQAVPPSSALPASGVCCTRDRPCWQAHGHTRTYLYLSLSHARTHTQPL